MVQPPGVHDDGGAGHQDQGQEEPVTGAFEFEWVKTKISQTRKANPWHQEIPEMFRFPVPDILRRKKEDQFQHRQPQGKTLRFHHQCNPQFNL